MVMNEALMNPISENLLRVHLVWMNYCLVQATERISGQSTGHVGSLLIRFVAVSGRLGQFVLPVTG